MKPFSFTKAERLKSVKTIGRLFKEGQSFGVYPLRLFWVVAEAPRSASPVQVSVSVPKKNFKKAVDRNRIRRKVKEAWRLHKHKLYRRLDPTGSQLACMVLYTAKEDLPYPQIEKAVQTMLHIFAKKSSPGKTNPSKQGGVIGSL